MGRKRKMNLIGQHFGRWEILERAPYRISKKWKGTEPIYTKDRNVMWKCKCECGTIKEIPTTRLLKGESKSCGCSRKKLT